MLEIEGKKGRNIEGREVMIERDKGRDRAGIKGGTQSRDKESNI